MEVNFFFFLISYGSRLERIIDYIPWMNGLEIGTELGFEPEKGQSLKQKKKIMKIKTNIYFIFNKILHTK